jgi:hypothetical protein
MMKTEYSPLWPGAWAWGQTGDCPPGVSHPSVPTNPMKTIGPRGQSLSNLGQDVIPKRWMAGTTPPSGGSFVDLILEPGNHNGFSGDVQDHGLGQRRVFMEDFGSRRKAPHIPRGMKAPGLDFPGPRRIPKGPPGHPGRAVIRVASGILGRIHEDHIGLF